jgi:hypothetical protein
MSEATEESLMQASSSSFSRRWISLLRSRVMMGLARVGSRSSRIGGGGTKEARTSPWTPVLLFHVGAVVFDARPARTLPEPMTPRLTYTNNLTGSLLPELAVSLSK